MPCHQRTESPADPRFKGRNGAVDRAEQNIAARGVPGFLRRAHGAEGHFIIGRPHQRCVGVTLEQLPGLFVRPLLVPFAIDHLPQTHLRVFAQGPLHAFFAPA